MRKILFCAIAALALAFTACNPNNPSNPGENNAADYVGTRWRIDSVFYNNQAAPHPYVIVKFISETQAVLDGVDTTSWSIKDGVLLMRRYDYEEMGSYKIVEANKTFAHLIGSDGAKDEMHIYASIIPEAEGTNLPLTAENIIGKWRGDYYVNRGNYIGNDGQTHEYYQMMSSVQMHGLDIWEFFADGTLTYTNMLDKASMDSYEPSKGFWAIKDGQFSYQYDVDRLDDGYYFDVEALTNNVFHILRTEHSQTGSNFQWCFFSKVK